VADDRERLDLALVARGLARSRSHAAQLIERGEVRVDGQVAVRPGARIGPATRLDVTPDPYVCRAAYKLLGALADLEAYETLPAPPFRALDAGASTGGFTQVLRERGADPVYAVDVGHDQLAVPLRADPGVVVHEGLNLRDLTLADVGDRPVDLVVADVSFISLTLLLEPVLGVLASSGTALLMVKPQFEVGRERLGSGGVVRSETLRRSAVDSVATAAAELGWPEAARVPSRLPGPAGNVEYFLLLRRGDQDDVSST